MDLLRDLMPEVSFLENKGQNDDNIKNLIRLVKDGLRKGTAKQLTANLEIPFEYGFTHGFLFSTYPIHKLDIKVHAYGKEKNHVGLTLQKQTFVENLRDFRPAVSYDLTGAKEMVDIQEDFKQKITEAVAKWGNKEKTGKLLAGYVKNLISFVWALTPKVKGKNRMRTYLRGMFMSWPGPSYEYTSKSPSYSVYTTKENMQIVVMVEYECLIVFYFDDKVKSHQTVQLSLITLDSSSLEFAMC
uniref:Uncharacterized protein n=1 Tax=Romanomermis culicivorax TaxID=13658 RepID=A0A915JVM1_ROMCU